MSFISAVISVVAVRKPADFREAFQIGSETTGLAASVLPVRLMNPDGTTRNATSLV